MINCEYFELLDDSSIIDGVLSKDKQALSMWGV
jgi:hypothetical protein